MSSSLCGECLRLRRYFDRAEVPFRYAFPLDRMVHALKYHGILSYGRVLGSLLCEHLEKRREPLPEVLLPVPLHPARHRERGFNQAKEIARPLARRLRLRIDEELCLRVRPTEDQTLLTAEARRDNVRRAFRARRVGVPRHVAIVDDVLTTGSTVNEVARVLKRAGVECVEVWAVARAHFANT